MPQNGIYHMIAAEIEDQTNGRFITQNPFI